MSTLDLTADVHLQVLSTVPYIRTFLTPREIAINKFTARYSWNVMELRVLATETSPGVWSISTFPGIASTPVDDLNDATYSFHGGNTWEISDSVLGDALEDAGYTLIEGAYTLLYETLYS